MLVLSRKQNQQIVIGDDIKITVLKIRGNSVRLGIEAPRHVHVVRGELSPATNAVEVTVEFKNHGSMDGDRKNSLRVFSSDSNTSESLQIPSINESGEEPQLEDAELDATRLQQIVARLTNS